ncbi:MAG: uncharacterized protein JWM16_2610 [Verrucomicrobiales bacterium]|jgi:hypothetical protein|nr:uncharacterized protein [Verrucomicrobiales bacterium]
MENPTLTSTSLPTSETDFVRSRTPPTTNERIDERTIEYLCHYVEQPLEVLSRRIYELDREWDIERWLEAIASGAALGGLAMGLGHKKRWLLLPGVVLPLLLLHATQGWSPPLRLLRRFGIRTRREIDAEKFALKVLRGDFEGIPFIMDETLRAVEAFNACTG